MPLVFDSNTISENGDNVIFNGTSVTQVVVDGTSVWNKYVGSPSPLIVVQSGTLVAGIDFPAGKPINLCMVGAGGKGAFTSSTPNPDATMEGGRAGEVVTKTLPSFDYGTNVVAEIYVFEGTEGDGTYLSDQPTKFGSEIALGGAEGAVLSIQVVGWTGDITSCGGTGLTPATVKWTWNSGSYEVQAQGGDSSGFSDGGTPNIDGVNSSGGVGSGGSGFTRNSGSPYNGFTGDGGRGEIRLSWS